MQTFDEILAYLSSKEDRNLHLLMGNGFSMSYDHKIFSYNALSKFVENSDQELLQRLFKAVNNKNFEQIMRYLKISKDLITALGGDKSIIHKMDQASHQLKIALIDAMKSSHPEHVFKISEAKSKSCANFLKPFLKSPNKIFSTNYDVLLYWILMRNEISDAIDGFGRDTIKEEDGASTKDWQYSELRWGKHKEGQNIFYLHGTLPIFDDGIEIIKEEYDGNPILENIKNRIESGHYPIFITAGNGDEKLNCILHNYYLSFCYDALCNIGGSLITFGFNFGEYDEHIIRAINKAAAAKDFKKKLLSIYIGFYSEDDRKHIESIKGKFNCKKVELFDSKSVNIWDK